MQALEDSPVKLQSSYLDFLPSLFRRELTINADARKLWVAGKAVELDEDEFDLLAFLYARQGTTCSVPEIADALKLGPEAEVLIAAAVDRVREKIESDPLNPKFLKTMTGGGYRLDSDEFMGRFLLIFESILAPIERMVDNLSLNFDPLLTPGLFLPWLASWLGLILDETWPEQDRRELVRRAAELWRWRGTRRGLSEYLRIYTGSTPEITEHVSGMRLGPSTRLGIGTQLGGSGGGYQFKVTLELSKEAKVDANKVRRIIEAQKPAHTSYTLQIAQAKDKRG